ncbi:MAG: Flp family type IVb pilin [Alphaproteobacteria bacterium]|nr:MAG: Flp family type IVb pilin [Alphaproteobacteria bacterium]
MYELLDFKALFKDEAAATSIEYALVAGMVSIAILGALSGLGTKIDQTFYQRLLSLFP